MAIRIECHNGYFGQVYITTNGAEFVERGQDFKLVDIAVDVDTDEIIYTVECLRLGKPTQFSIPKKHAIDKKKLLEYANMGLDVNDSNVTITTEVFSIKEAEYIEAMDKAVRLKDTASIKKFYYYKICDSIVELDIKERVKQTEKQKTIKSYHSFLTSAKNIV